MDKRYKHSGRFKRTAFAFILILSSALNIFIYGNFFNNTPVAYAETIVIGTDNTSEALFKEKFANAPDGTVLDLNGNQNFTVRSADSENWLINNHNIKVINGTLNLRYSGIICNGDLTFDNVELNLNKTDGAVVVTNGHNLTLNNVTKYSGNSTDTTIFGGSIVNSTEVVPAPGNWSQSTINIEGKCDLGKIFMGNYDAQKDGKPLESGMSDYGKAFSSCTVNILDSCTQYSKTRENRTIYASGGYMTGQNSFVATPNACPVTSGATINSFEDNILAVEGETGRNWPKATFNYYGGEYVTDNVTLHNLTSLQVKSGKFQPKSDTSFALPGYRTRLGVSSGAFLYAGNLGDATFMYFDGGGTLNLGKTRSDTSQTLTIKDAVTGTTEMEFGNTVGFRYAGVVDTNYIVAPKSGAGSFKVSNLATGQRGYWTRDSSGNWLFSSTKPGIHEHVYDYGKYTYDDHDHWFQCTDVACPDIEGSKIGLAEHEYEDDRSRNCLDCDYKRVIITDIFKAKDNTKMELLKERVFNSLLHSQSSIDVSDLGLSHNDIVYITKEGNSLTGSEAARSMVREHPFFSTLCITGSATFEYAGGFISRINYTISDYTWKPEIISLALESYEQAIASVKPGMTTVQKLAVLHDWECDHVNYSMNGTMADFAIGALAYGGAVCAGYAQCYQFLLDQLDIENVYVSAQTPSEPHAWNLVKVDGYWFHVDTTWDDGVAGSNSFHHAYFLLNDDEFKASGDDNGDGIGSHGADWLDQNKYPSNTKAYFENKYWNGVSGYLTSDLLVQDPKLTLKKDPAPEPSEPEATLKFALPSLTEGTFKVLVNGLYVDDGTKIKENDKISVEFSTNNHKEKDDSILCYFVKRIKIGDEDVFNIDDYDKTKWLDTRRHTSYDLMVSDISRERLTQSVDIENIVDGKEINVVVETEVLKPVFRLFNNSNAEHLYTQSKGEYEFLSTIGWEPEGIDWFCAPIKPNSKKVIRLYNEGIGSSGKMSHYYTSDLGEAAGLVAECGWVYDTGIEFADEGDIPIYTAYIDLKASHLYTSNLEEYRGLREWGWDLQPNGNGFSSLETTKTEVGTGFFKCKMSAR